MSTPSAASRPRTLGELRASGHRSVSVRDEIRRNVMSALRAGRSLFPRVIGYDKTVVPQMANALLSRHDLILLGLRGQAKTRLALSLEDLLDEWVPVVAGAPLRDDPLGPYLTPDVARRAQELGDDLPIAWLHRSERIQEKLATPDITMGDLIGDLDPIKAATEGRNLMDPEVLQYGLIPRTHRGIFVLNELPDLPTRIQVGLFDLLERRPIQIRGFPIGLELDVLFVFTANPEDYTNRGNIVTPLRDRIKSQIHTHYPSSLQDSLRITEQEADQQRPDGPTLNIPGFLREAVEETAIQARTSSFVDQSSGVSARVSISLLENLLSNAERRALLAGAATACARPGDLFAALPGLAGKVELVFEGEQEGPLSVCNHLLGKGLKAVFDRYFEDPYKEGSSHYESILDFFRRGEVVRTSEDASDRDSYVALAAVPGLEELAAERLTPADPGERVAAMELVLEGLHQASLLGKRRLAGTAEFRDQMDEMMEDLERS